MTQLVENQSKFDSIVRQLKAEDSDDRRWAIYDLEEFDPALITDHLVDAIQDEHRAVREAASELLETIPPSLCVEKLVPLLGSVRIEVRNIVASVLVTFGGEAVDGLLPALFHENEDVRKFSADILGLAGSAKAVPGLCKAAMDDDVANVVVSAIEALGKIGSKDALPSLYQIFQEKEIMRKETIESIGLIGDPDSTDFLADHIFDDDPMVQFAVVDALGNIGESRSIPFLKKYMSKTSDLLKEQSCRAILKIGQRAKVNVFNDDEIGLCDFVVKLLSEQHDDMVDLVNYQLGLDPNIQVIKTFFNGAEILPSSLVVALINYTQKVKELKDILSSLVEHEDDWVAYSALEALGNFEKNEVKDTILGVIHNGTGLRVIAAIKTAVALQLKEAVPALETLSQSQNDDIRGAAAQALNQLK